METAIVVIIVAIAAWYTGRRIYRTFTGGNGCDCNEDCSCCDQTVIPSDSSPPDDKGAV